MATFTLSDTSTAYIGATLQSSSITKNNFKTVVTYTIKAKDIASTKTYTVTVYTNKNTACDLLTYGFVSPAVTGTITTTGSGGNVNLTVPYGTNLTAIKAWFTLSDSANARVSNIKQNSNVTMNDFTSPVIYQVIAQDTTVTKTYIVYVKMGKSQSCDLLQYSLQSPAVNGVITTIGTTGGTVALTLPFGSGLSALVANFKVSDSATAFLQSVKQISGSSANNYKSILKYKVIAQDTNFSKIYDVSATVLKSDKAELFTYCLLSPADTGVITKTTGGGFVNITVPFNTDLTNLTGVFTLSDSAKASVLSVAQKSGITNNNFTDLSEIAKLFGKQVIQNKNRERSTKWYHRRVRKNWVARLSKSCRRGGSNAIYRSFTMGGGKHSGWQGSSPVLAKCKTVCTGHRTMASRYLHGAFQNGKPSRNSALNDCTLIIKLVN